MFDFIASHGKSEGFLKSKGLISQSLLPSSKLSVSRYYSLKDSSETLVCSVSNQTKGSALDISQPGNMK